MRSSPPKVVLKNFLGELSAQEKGRQKLKAGWVYVFRIPREFHMSVCCIFDSTTIPLISLAPKAFSRISRMKLHVMKGLLSRKSLQTRASCAFYTSPAELCRKGLKARPCFQRLTRTKRTASRAPGDVTSRIVPEQDEVINTLLCDLAAQSLANAKAEVPLLSQHQLPILIVDL